MSRWDIETLTAEAAFAAREQLSLMFYAVTVVLYTVHLLSIGSFSTATFTDKVLGRYYYVYNLFTWLQQIKSRHKIEFNKLFA